MKIESRLQGLKRIRPKVHRDARGSFFELFRANQFEDIFVQDNCSVSKRGVIRGMHFQRHPGQAKLVTVLEGEIFDVVVDMRMDSPTFGLWEGVPLSSENREQLLIPVGFAHGFCVLSKQACVMYKMTSYYDPAEEKEFRFDDPEVGIEWPVESPSISDRDQNAMSFQEAVKCLFG